MDLRFDLNKDKANREKHGVSLAEAANFEWDTALVWLDEGGRKDSCGNGQ